MAANEEMRKLEMQIAQQLEELRRMVVDRAGGDMITGEMRFLNHLLQRWCVMLRQNRAEGAAAIPEGDKQARGKAEHGEDGHAKILRAGGAGQPR